MAVSILCPQRENSFGGVPRNGLGLGPREPRAQIGLATLGPDGHGQVFLGKPIFSRQSQIFLGQEPHPSGAKPSISEVKSSLSDAKPRLSGPSLSRARQVTCTVSPLINQMKRVTHGAAAAAAGLGPGGLNPPPPRQQ